ncbi:hypothetical protein ABH966_004415 [Lysinibacillus sp. RC46]
MNALSVTSSSIRRSGFSFRRFCTSIRRYECFFRHFSSSIHRFVLFPSLS